MKVLVTGGAGYIGAHTVHALLKEGYDPVVVDNLSRGYRHNVEPGRLRVMDIRDTAALRDLMLSERVSAVIHFAAFASVAESMEQPSLYFHNNVGCTASLLLAMEQAGVRLIVFSSTAAVYGIPQNVPIPEDGSKRPINPYGESKLMAEKMLEWVGHCKGIRSISLRYFNAAGAYPEARLGEEHEPETHLIPNVLRAIKTGRPVTIHGTDYDTPDGTCIRDFIHVHDLAQAHILALRGLVDGLPSGVFNVGTGIGHSVLEVVKAAEEVTGKSVPRVIGPRRPGDPPALVADPSRLRHALGWEPTFVDLRDIVRSAWEFEKLKA